MTKAELYRDLVQAAGGLLSGERDAIANAANLSALIWEYLPDLNWAGFYFLRGEGLVLGPFMGKPACTRLTVGKGVCGTAVAKRQTIIVPDVHEFGGHVACDSASNSEIVLPLFQGAAILGVLDLDSPLLSRFDEEDARGLETLAALWVAQSDSLP